MKILLCFGTRPEAIKMAPVIFELRKQNIDFKICVTAQHREMLDQVLDFFEIVPDYDLNLMQPDQSLNLLASQILCQLDSLLDKINPDIILVQGDTTTAFIASLAAFNRKVKIGHLEAGLRTGNLISPFPEEGNRQLISRIASIHFAPTFSAKQNLLQESIPGSKILITGNTVVDSLSLAKSKLDGGYIDEEINYIKNIIHRNKRLILVTGHRRENFGEGLEEVCLALIEIAKLKDVQIIFPVHPNPVVQKPVFNLLGSIKNIDLINPVSYPTFIYLMTTASIILSDSGGIQEEAPSLKKPVVVTRESTERPEGIESGYCFLTGTSKSRIIDKVISLLEFPPEYSNKTNPFGDGKASQLIVNHLKQQFIDEPNP